MSDAILETKFQRRHKKFSIKNMFNHILDEIFHEVVVDSLNHLNDENQILVKTSVYRRHHRYHMVHELYRLTTDYPRNERNL